MVSEELKGAELFIFMDNLVFESIFYKGTSKILLLFEIVLRLHQLQMIGELVLHVIHIVVIRIIEAGIDSIYGGENLGGMIRGVNSLQFYPLYQGVVVRSANLEPWIRNWWGESLNSIIAKDWFEHKGYNLLWATLPATAETSLDLLLKSRLQQPYKSHVVVVPWLITFSWRKHMGKEVDLLFTVTVGMP